jgi:hypothetical protein
MPPAYQLKYELQICLTNVYGTWYLTNGLVPNSTTYYWVNDSSFVCTYWSGMFVPSLHVTAYLNINFTVLPPHGGGTGTFTFNQANSIYNIYYNIIHVVGATLAYHCQNFYLAQQQPNGNPTSGTVLFAAGNVNAATSILSLPDTLIGDVNSGGSYDSDGNWVGSSVVDIGKIMTSDGSTWVNSSSWRIKNGTENKNINQLMVNEVMKGQQTPCPQDIS